MKAVKVFVFAGGRSGYIELAEEGKLLPFYCYSEGNVAQTKLDISFKRGDDATTNMKGIARQAIHTYRENKDKNDVTYTVETQGNKTLLKKEILVVQADTDKVEDAGNNPSTDNSDAESTEEDGAPTA